MKISSSSFYPQDLGAVNFAVVVYLEESNSREKKESLHTHAYISMYTSQRTELISREN